MPKRKINNFLKTKPENKQLNARLKKILKILLIIFWNINYFICCFILYLQKSGPLKYMKMD